MYPLSRTSLHMMNCKFETFLNIWVGVSRNQGENYLILQYLRLFFKYRDLTWNDETSFTTFEDVFLTFHAMIFKLWINWPRVSTYTWVNTHGISYLHFFRICQFSVKPHLAFHKCTTKIFIKDKRLHGFSFSLVARRHFIKKKPKKKHKKEERRQRGQICVNIWAVMSTHTLTNMRMCILGVPLI